MNEKFSGVIAKIFVIEIEEELAEMNSEIDGVEPVNDMDDDQQLLLTASVNYADEFDMSEWLIIDAGTFKGVIKKAKEYDNEVEWYFGSNEQLSFENGSDMLSNITVKAISQEESDAVKSVFGYSEFGDANFFDNLFDLSDEDEDEDEDGEGFLGPKEKKWIDFLKEHNYIVTHDDEDEYMFDVINDDNVSRIPYSYLKYLHKYVKKNY